MAGEPIAEGLVPITGTQPKAASLLARAEQSRRDWEQRRPWGPPLAPAVEVQNRPPQVAAEPGVSTKTDIAEEFFQSPIELRFKNPFGEVLTDSKDKTRLEWRIDDKRSIFLRPATFVKTEDSEKAVVKGKELLESLTQGQTVRIMEDEHEQPFELRDKVAKAILAGIEASGVSNIKPLDDHTSLADLANENCQLVIEKKENVGPAKDKMTTLKWMLNEDVQALKTAQVSKTDN